MTRSAPKLLLEERPMSRHQEEIKTPRQDKAERCLLCLLACLDGSCSDGSCLEAMLGLDRKIQFRIVKDTPRCNKSKITHRKGIQYIQYIFVLHQSIYMRKRKTFKFPIQKTFFKKFFSHLVFIFKFSISEAPNQLHGKMTLEAFFFQNSVGTACYGSAVSSIQCLDGSIIIISASGRALLVSSSFFNNRV